jgi:hypothetical protein
MSALALKPLRQQSCWHYRPAGWPTVQRCLGGRIAAVGGAMLVAGLAVSCASDRSPGATADQQSTTTAATAVTATAAGQTLRGTGYSVSLPAGWRDTTTKQKALGAQVDLAAAGTSTEGAVTNLWVAVESSPGGSLADLVAAVGKGLKQGFGARLLGQPERLSLAGTPAMALEFTHSMKAGSIQGRQVVCLRDDRVYVVALVARAQAFTTDRAALDQILASWSWG